MTVYLVMGTTGEFEDHQEWVASVCRAKRTADVRARKLNEIAVGSKRKYNSATAKTHLLDQLREAGDVAPRLDYTGIEYHVDGPYEVCTNA